MWAAAKPVYDNSPEYIQQALEESLRRLNTDYIDVYLIHYRDGKTPIADVVGKLEELKAAGKAPLLRPFQHPRRRAGGAFALCGALCLLSGRAVVGLPEERG